MPVNADWDNEDRTIIRIRLYDVWEMNEYFEASLKAQSFMKSVGYPVHLIFDLTDMSSFPKNILSSIRTIDSHILPNQGLVINVRSSRYLQAITSIAARVFPRIGLNVHFTQSLEEAYELIRKYDQATSNSQ